MPNNALIEYNASIDLGNGELVRSLFENLAAHPTAPLFAGRVYWNITAEDLFIYTGSAWIQMGEMYIHPTFAELDQTTSLAPDLATSGGPGVSTGSRVLASFEVNGEGHVIAATTRLLTLADLGYTGALDANNYGHYTRPGDLPINKTLSGVKILDSLQVNSEGHVTDYTTRTLEPADIGAAIINDSVTNLIDTWSSTKISGEIANALVGALKHKGGYNASTNTPALSGVTSGITQGWVYVITAAGTFNTVPVAVGDMIIADIDNPGGTSTVDTNGDPQLNDWTVVNKNIPDIVDATNVDRGIIRLATEAEVLAGIVSGAAVTPATLVAFYDANEAASGWTSDIGDTTALVYDVSHGLATKLVQAEIFANVSGRTIMTEITRTTTGNVRVNVNTAPGIAAYKILIKKV